MKTIQILPLGKIPDDLVRFVSAELAKIFLVRCEVLAPRPDPGYAFDPVRQQYCSTRILMELDQIPLTEGTRLLALVSFDLYIPILTFVFGEAQMRGACAVVSTFRLQPEFYGLPGEPGVLRARLVKECVHELGHTFGIPHCDNYSCVMAPSHTVEWIDLKSSNLCEPCLAKARIG